MIFGAASVVLACWPKGFCWPGNSSARRITPASPWRKVRARSLGSHPVRNRNGRRKYDLDQLDQCPCAHVSGAREEVRGFYLSFKGWKRGVGTSWENVILQDFAQLRDAGHSHPLMDEIEKRLVDEGWTVQPGNKCTQQPRMNSHDAIFIKTNPDDIKSGDLLAEHGDIDRAAAVYIRNLERWHTKLKQGGTSPAGQANLQIAAGRVAGIARKCLHAGRFVVAFDYVDQALAAAPDNLELLVIRALALMLRNSNDEAQAIFLRYRGQKIGDQTWEAVVAAEFQELRKAKYQHPLMDRIEKEFAVGVGIIRPADGKWLSRDCQRFFSIAAGSILRCSFGHQAAGTWPLERGP